MPYKQITEQKLNAILDRLDREEYFAFLETTRCTPENRRSLLFMHPTERLVCRSDDDIPGFIKKMEERLQAGFHLAGWLAYEAGYLLEPVLAREFRFSRPAVLAEFLVCRAPYVFDHELGRFTGASPWPANLDDLPQAHDPRKGEYTIHDLRLNQSREEYIAAIHRIKNYIAAGHTYQVNHTLKFKFDLTGSLAGFYKTLRRNQSVSYSSFLKTGSSRIMSFSPELFFRKSGSVCQVKPMKGTIRRGQTPDQDKTLIDFLRNDRKNRSENVMIVDLLRNDLGRLCRMGSVKVSSLFDVETYESLHQMTSTIEGELLPGLGYAEIFKALFPSGSVTGAPKIRTMQIIRELELEARGVYTGAIGHIGPAGEACFNVPIRTIVVDGRQCEMGVGSGIVFDSDPEGEWDECRLKGRFLTNPVPEFSLIETLLWTPEAGYWLLTRHLDRLLASARYFGFAAETEDLVTGLAGQAKDFSPVPHRVRLTVDRQGQTTITATPCPPPLVTGLIDDDREPTAALPAVIVSNLVTDSASVFLYHKTDHRPFYEQERARALAAGYFEVLFANERQEITEGAITTVFVKMNDVLLTPPVSCGLLPGVFRGHLLATLPGKIREQVLTRSDLEQAEAIYVGNSVRGLVRVRLADGKG